MTHNGMFWDSARRGKLLLGYKDYVMNKSIGAERIAQQINDDIRNRFIPGKVMTDGFENNHCIDMITLLILHNTESYLITNIW